MSGAGAVRARITLLLAALLLAGGALAGSDAPRVRLGDVEFEGRASGTEGAAEFLGIPFAQPPTGALRWAPPQPWQAEGTHRDATRFAPACMQTPRLVEWYRKLIASFDADPASFPAPAFGEDCLYVNVWRPAVAPGARLPVLVWIHGGSNTSGWSHEPNYHGERLAARGVVVVSIAYRLGVFGFFSLPGLGQSNFGLLDQIAALAWVRANIAAFGGDPANVTVAGESSGANDIAHLLAAPRARGLYARAIMQSGGSSLTDRGDRAQALERGAALARELGTPADATALAALRALPAERVLAAAQTVYAGQYFDPVVDGDSVPEPARAAIAAGRLAPVPLLIGTNADEWSMYIEQPIDEARWLRENAPGREAAVAAALGEESRPLRRMDRLISAQVFVCPSLWLAGQVRAHGGDAFVYHFTRVREGPGGARMGAYHGAEIPYLFDTHDSWLPTAAADRRLGAAIMEYWLRFAASGDPNGAGAPRWPGYSAAAPLALELGDRIAPQPHPETALCRALDPGAAR